jgi:hypothetical protein
MIASMLYIWKYLNNEGFRGNLISIKPGDGSTYTPGSFLVPTQEGTVSSEIEVSNISVEFSITYSTKAERLRKDTNENPDQYRSNSITEKL